MPETFSDPAAAVAAVSPAARPRFSISSDEARAIEKLDPALYNTGLVPVPPLTADDLRRRFAETREWTHEMLGDHQFGDLGFAEDEYRPASVLVPIVVREELQLLLTQRTSHLKEHSGQVAFPGGRAEPGDANVAATALREAQEEIGLAADRVEVIGCLPHYRTGTRYDITPVIALVHPPFDLTPNAGEVADVFEVPLSFLLDPANHERRARPWTNGRLRHFYAMPYQSYFIWGATAAMLRNLYHYLRA